MEFAQRVLKLLENQGRRQVELADFVGVKPNTVSDWLHKQTSPKLNHLCRISEFLGVSLDYLLTGAERQPIGERLNENEKEMLALFRALPDREQIKMIVRLEDLVNSNEAWKNLFRRLQGRDAGIPAPVDHI